MASIPLIGQPFVSIIIPCYNAEAYIAEAIESALAQTYPHCEVLVVNDGSEDASTKIIERYQGRIRYFQTDNQGACHARNIGLQAAQGERVQWLDADDVLRPNCVESKLNLSDDKINIPICDVASMNRGRLAAFWNRPSYDFITALAYGSPPTPAPLHYRKDLIAIGGFSEDLPCAQEFDLHLRLLAHRPCRFVSTDQVGVDIRTHDASLSRRAGANMYHKIVEILENIEHNNDLTVSHSEAIAHHQIRASQQLWRIGNKTDALLMYHQALAKLPKGIQPRYFITAEGWWLRAIGLSNFEMLRALFSSIKKLFIKH
nr:glycosyltransferase family 2 protein [Halomonas sp. UBA3074]